MVPNPIFLMDDLGGVLHPYFWRATHLPRDTNSLPHGLSLTQCAKHLGLIASLLEAGSQSIGAIPQATQQRKRWENIQANLQTLETDELCHSMGCVAYICSGCKLATKIAGMTCGTLICEMSEVIWKDKLSVIYQAVA